MNESTQQEIFLDLNKSVIISNYYAIFLLVTHLITNIYYKESIQKLGIFKPYFLTEISAGNYITIYIWALLDAFTVCTFIIFILYLKSLISAKNDNS